MKESLQEMFSGLVALLREAGSAVLAFSGGVDSSFLLKAMKVAGMRVLAVTAVSETMPSNDVRRAVAFAEQTGVEHRILEKEDLANESFASNPPDRCFYCRDDLFKRIKAIAAADAYRFTFDGSNADDLHDYRPGRRAAEIHGVRSPLAECDLSKRDIREMSKELGLSTWDSPSSPCLSSRFPYGRRITVEALRRVEKAEEFLKTLGLRDIRVRDLGDTARIEVAEESMGLLIDPEKRRLLVGALRSLGYLFISLDLEGYRSGSLNRGLQVRKN